MKRISYSGGSFLTSDAVADALAHFVAALGSSHRAEALEVPVIKDNGESDVVQMVIGPASELVSTTVDSAFAEPESAAAVQNMVQKTIALGRPRPIAESQSEATATGFDYDEV
ncbi:hypothetical protein [Subtercola frigoramans]|uniref:Uncharacterized protein n=1 Tax=Subtercola frigoramans TaxID=120298 RepID=A0ABS2L1X2_9MICO|nr:hypothetical protein [Subtercola frigoramans]MBM7471062.1 hypothetical protein [Subtercola frigoramans]